MKSSNQFILGKGIAILHKNSTKDNPNLFGWSKKGYIGIGEQPKGWNEKWGNLFIQLRLCTQLKTASKWGLNIENYQQLLDKLINYLNKHHPEPSLVHGDLWSGNAGINEEGLGTIYDPACYWADREVDIAMTKLFGGFSNDFYNRAGPGRLLSGRLSKSPILDT